MHSSETGQITTNRQVQRCALALALACGLAGASAGVTHAGSRSLGGPAQPFTPAQAKSPIPSEPDWLDDDFDLESEFSEATDEDPWEGFNRAIFAVNREIDRFVLNPVTDIYQALIPNALRKGIHNAFVNLDAPVRITNSLFQARPKAAATATARFVLNSTFGLGGLFEAGERVGLEQQPADFGQTLASWGVPRGPYVVVPVMGPMTVRNGIGMGADVALQPLSYVAGPLPGMMVGAGKDFTRREQSFVELKALQNASLDFYAAFRSAFLQDRAELDAVTVETTDPGSDHPSACARTSGQGRRAVKPLLRGRHQRRCDDR